MILDRFTDKIDDQLTLIRRTGMLERWAEISGVEDVKDVDFTIPRVHLEFLLCDSKILRMISGGKRRNEFLEMLTEEERELYLNTEPDDDGATYLDLENPKVVRQMKKDAERLEKEEKKRARKALRASKRGGDQYP